MTVVDAAKWLADIGKNKKPRYARLFLIDNWE